MNDTKESNKENFSQDLSGEQLRPGGPFMIQLLFQNPVEMRTKVQMQTVISKFCGEVDCFSYDEKMAGFAVSEHIAEFKDGKVPVQLMVMSCTSFEAENVIDDFARSQMWDCEEKDKVLSECRYQVLGTDMMAGALPAIERAKLDVNFLDALLELYPECEAVYMRNCGKLFLAEDIRNEKMTGLDRFIKFGVNARFFNIQGTGDMVIDTVGMSTLFLPDVQYHFHGKDPNEVVFHAYNLASYILQNDCPIAPGETVDGICNGRMVRELQWQCWYEEALIQPVREVLDVCMGEYASGDREE